MSFDPKSVSLRFRSLPAWGLEIWRFIGTEVHLCGRFIRGDLWVTLVPAALWMGTLALRHGVRAEAALVNLVLGTVYFGLFIYPFCLSNQWVGIAEDRINKPDRPLVRGDVTPAGALRRYGVYSAGFLVLGAALGVFPWAVMWVGVTFLHNFTALGHHWAFKSGLLMGVGGVAQLMAGAGIMLGEGAPEALGGSLVVAVWVTLGAAVQDFRDLEGDRSLGRKTLPLVLGEARARRCMVVVFGLLALASAFYWPGVGPGFALGNLVLAYRLLRFRSRKADARTYRIFAGLYCGLVLIVGLGGS